MAEACNHANKKLSWFSRNKEGNLSVSEVLIDDYSNKTIQSANLCHLAF